MGRSGASVWISEAYGGPDGRRRSVARVVRGRGAWW